jgi:hypothetical protein
VPGPKAMSPGACRIVLYGVRALRGAVLSALVAAVAAVALAAPMVDTASGCVASTQTQEVAVFKGLPYAAPPVGALRWRAPQPAAPWPGTRDPSKAGDAGPQKRGLSLMGGGDPGILGPVSRAGRCEVQECVARIRRKAGGANGLHAPTAQRLHCRRHSVRALAPGVAGRPVLATVCWQARADG